ncbi:MAG TPA: CbiX/SirB N-terminal domain-containing protein [Anaerolineaceae bacterium]|nr:CbiX/SirB N-terminal domain-containing protein [Anaerolineaceae bacterium]
MKTTIVLAMHGAPPKDFPPREVMEFMNLHARFEHGGPPDPAAVARHAELDEKIRRWPRTAENDPFFAASEAMAQALAGETGLAVRVGFNEFCAPTLTEALEAAAASGAGRVAVITPMLTRGGEHAEVEIPAVIAECQARHPAVTFDYCWPFDLADIARFLAARVQPAP